MNERTRAWVASARSALIRVALPHGPQADGSLLLLFRWGCASLVFLVGACTLVLRAPRNLIGKFGEDAIAACWTLTAPPALARLYRGDGGVTTGFWYTVTLEIPGLTERKFFGSYSLPEVKSIHCRDDGTVAVVTQENVWPYSVREIVRRRWWRPVRYSDGVRDDSVQTAVWDYVFDLAPVMLLVLACVVARPKAFGIGRSARMRHD